MTDTVSVPLPDGVMVSEPVTESELVAVALDVPFTAAPADAVAGELAVAQLDTLAETVPVPDTDGEGDTEFERVVVAVIV